MEKRFGKPRVTFSLFPTPSSSIKGGTQTSFCVPIFYLSLLSLLPLLSFSHSLSPIASLTILRRPLALHFPFSCL